MSTIIGVGMGFIAWGIIRFILSGFFTVDQNQRAVKTVFGQRASDWGNLTTSADPIAESLREDEEGAVLFSAGPGYHAGRPLLQVAVGEGVQSLSRYRHAGNMAFDPESPEANKHGTVLEAVTKDQLNTGLTGQIRFQVSERNLYAYLFGVTNAITHVMGYFVSVLRERIATFEAPGKKEAEGTTDAVSVEGISINDLRKNLLYLNEHMDRECQCSQARYGIQLDASLITGIDPPPEVESALAAINTAHNQVSSDISLATAAADQRIVESRCRGRVEMLKAEADVEPLAPGAAELVELKRSGGKAAMDAYVRNAKMALCPPNRVITEMRP